MNRILSIVLVLFISLASVIPASAGGVDPNPETYRYFFVNNPPIPVGEVVEFTKLTDGRITLKWDKRVGRGHAIRHMIFEGVDISWRKFEKHAGSGHTAIPEIGDLGIIRNYSGKQSSIADLVIIDEFRVWDSVELELLRIADQFYQEMVSNGLFYFHGFGGDCVTQGATLNGQPLQEGPFLDSYQVPSEGGMLSVFYTGDEWCSQGKSRTVWTGRIVAGDEFVGDSLRKVTYDSPWEFCLRLQYMTPQWQPITLNQETKEACPEIYARDDLSIPANLARLGFLRIEAPDDPRPENVVSYAWTGNGHVELKLPNHRWMAVDRIEVGSNIYSAHVGYTKGFDTYFPKLSWVDGEKGVEYGTDAQWIEWGTPIVFVPSDTKSTFFDWKQLHVFRIVRSGFEQVTIHQLVWDEN